MTLRYMIYCCAGTGGLFLTTVFAQILGYQIKSKFSNTGHAHDMGRGNWRGAQSVCFIGDHWDLGYKPSRTQKIIAKSLNCMLKRPGQTYGQKKNIKNGLDQVTRPTVLIT